MSETVISVENLSKKFCRDLKRSLWYGLKDIGKEIFALSSGENFKLRKNEFWALDNINFELNRGDCLGLIGRNGAGKTTLLRLLNGLIKPDLGKITMRGRVSALIALGSGFNPVLTGRENIYINGSVLGLTKKEIDQKIDQIIDFAEIKDFIDAPVQSYSSGMHVKLGFSIAAILLEPDILLLDEVLAVGDLAFQNKAMRRMNEHISRSNALILVSHNLDQIRIMCNKVMVIDNGQILYFGDSDKGLIEYENLSKNHRIKSINKDFIDHGFFRYRRVDGDRVIFNDLGLLNNQNESVSEVKVDEPLRVYLDFHINEQSEDLYFTLSILNEKKDTDCLWVKSNDFNRFPFYNVQPGDYRVIVKFIEHNLAPGIYYINYSIRNGKNSELYDHGFTDFAFAVKSDQHFERGIVHSVDEWELTEINTNNE